MHRTLPGAGLSRPLSGAPETQAALPDPRLAPQEAPGMKMTGWTVTAGGPSETPPMIAVGAGPAAPWARMRSMPP